MAVEKLIAHLGLNKTGFDAGMASAGKQVNKFGADLKSRLAGGLSAVAISAFVKSIAAATGRIKDLGEQYGITTDEVQKADFALKQSGLAFEELGTSLSRLGQARRAAVEGNEDLRRTFERYGLAVRDLNDPQLRTYDILLKIASATREGNVSARDQTALMDLLGNKALKLSNVLNSLATIKPPSLFSKEDIDSIDKMTKSLQNLSLQAQTMASGPIARMADTVTGLLRGAGGFVTGKVPEGSAVQKRSGGIAGRFELFADLLEETAVKERVAVPFAQGLMAPIQAAFNKLLGTKSGGLYEVDKNAPTIKQAANKIKSSGGFGVDESAFGRIGAFTGAAASASVTPGQAAQIEAINKLRDELVVRGIIVRDVKR